MIPKSDMALVAQVVLMNDNRAFDQLVVKYQSAVRRFFLNLTCGDGQLSDDLAQDTFVKAYTHLKAFKNLSSFSTWLYRIAYNVFYDYIRGRKLTSDINKDEIDLMYQTEDEGFAKKDDIYKALARLKEEERICITLSYMEDQPMDKIATITGIPLGTVKSHIHRGKVKLATYLKENGYDGNR